MRIGFVLSITMAATFTISGCNRLACERMAECTEARFTGPSAEELVERCVESLEDEDSACRRAYRALARCLDRENCDQDACSEESDEAATACEFI